MHLGWWILILSCSIWPWGRERWPTSATFCRLPSLHQSRWMANGRRGGARSRKIGNAIPLTHDFLQRKEVFNVRKIPEHFVGWDVASGHVYFHTIHITDEFAHYKLFVVCHRNESRHAEGIAARMFSWSFCYLQLTRWFQAKDHRNFVSKSWNFSGICCGLTVQPFKFKGNERVTASYRLLDVQKNLV